MSCTATNACDIGPPTGLNLTSSTVMGNLLFSTMGNSLEEGLIECSHKPAD